MQPTFMPKKVSLSLTSAKRASLRNIALLFGIEFHRVTPVKIAMRGDSIEIAFRSL